MAEFIESKNGRLVFGLIWKQVQNVKKEKAEGTAFSRKHKAIYKLRWSKNAAIRYAVVPKAKNDAEAKKKSDVLSGAVLFSSQVPADTNSLLIFPLDGKGTKYSVVAVVNGIPYLDVVISHAQVRDRVLALSQEGYTEFATYGRHSDYPDALPWGIEDFSSGVRKEALMVKASDIGPMLVRAGVLIVAASIAAGFAITDYFETKREEEEAAKNQVDPAGEYKRKLSQMLKNGGLSGVKAYEVFWLSRSKRELIENGWEIVSVTCNKAACIEQLSRLNGTNETLIAALPKDASYSFGPGKDTGNTIYVSKKNSVKAALIDQSMLPKKVDFWKSFTSAGQWFSFEKDFIGDLGVVYTPVAAKIYGIPTGVAVSDIPKSILVEQGTYVATGSLGLLRETLMRTATNMAIDEVTMIMSNDMDAARFTVKGSYYVKN